MSITSRPYLGSTGKIPQISLTPLYTQFSPRSIPGCTLWLDAADPTTISGTSSITAWNDKSGSGNNAIFTGTNPSYTPANKYVETSGLNQAFSVPGTIFNTVGGSLFIVYADKQQNTQNGMLYAISDGYTPYYFDQCLYRADGYSYALGGVDIPSNDFKTALNTRNTLIYSINYVHNTSNYNVTVNGTVFPFTSINGTRVVVPSGSMVFSGGWGGAANIKFNEILFFNSILTTIQREQVESYLAQKWGLTATLPSFPGVKGIPGCALWLDAADSASMTTSSGNLLTWNDKSGNGYVMTNNTGTTTVASSSLNSLNTVYTPSGTNTKITNFIGRTKCTMFIVGKAATSRYLLALNGGFLYTANDSLLYFSPPTGNYLDIIDSVGLATPVVSNNTWFILCIGYDNATNNTANPYTINGTNRSTVIIPRGTPGILSDQYITSPLYINSVNGTNSYDSVYTAEIIYYNNTLTTTERQQIEGYLAAKWGLQSSLPNTHPYYTKAPINHINNTQPAGLRTNLTLATAQRVISYIPYPIT